MHQPCVFSWLQAACTSLHASACLGADVSTFSFPLLCAPSCAIAGAGDDSSCVAQETLPAGACVLSYVPGEAESYFLAVGE